MQHCQPQHGTAGLATAGSSYPANGPAAAMTAADSMSAFTGACPWREHAPETHPQRHCVFNEAPGGV